MLKNIVVNRPLNIDEVHFRNIRNTDISSITFTKLDTVRNIASGRFAFNLTKSDGSIVEVTDGRFDCMLSSAATRFPIA